MGRPAGFCRIGALSIVMMATAHADITVMPEEMARKSQWVQQHLMTATNPPPFSFTYGGQPSSGLLPSWRRQEADAILDSNRTQHSISWTNGTFRVTCVAVEYKEFPVVEWIAYMTNIGPGATPILEAIQGLDTNVSRTPASEFVLHCNKGDQTTKDSYEPYDITLNPSADTEFTPLHIPDVENELKGVGISESGKSCDGPKGWPYYNLQFSDGGIILAIGWPGQWASKFSRDASLGLRLTAGQQLTHLYLRAGETIRTPLIAMLFWQGTDVDRAQNIWRRWFLAENEPRVDGEAQQPIAQTSSGGFLLDCGRENASRWIAKLEAGVQLGDAMLGTMGDGTWWPSKDGAYHVVKPGEQTSSALRAADAWWNTGTWDIDPIKFPNGFKSLSESAHANGLKFMVWFEPERVGNPNSWLGKNHPEWLLPKNSLTYGIHPSFDPILDEGNPAARNWLINHVDALIKSQGIDVYREDMNGAGPCPAWRQNDPHDRQGITENFYVQGHLAFWDELRRRNPHLRIDSCASGGRRNDLETMRRAVVIGNRSDFIFALPDVVEGNQGQTFGLSAWLPFQGSCSLFSDSYSYRSYYLTSFGEHSDKEAQRKAYGEWRRVASYMLGDYYPLTHYSLERDRWIAWQFDRPDLGGGVVQAFRRPDSPYETAHFKLRGLNAAGNYEVENLDGGKEVQTGRELSERGLPITAISAPAALVFIYRRLD